MGSLNFLTGGSGKRKDYWKYVSFSLLGGIMLASFGRMFISWYSKHVTPGTTTLVYVVAYALAIISLTPIIRFWFRKSNTHGNLLPLDWGNALLWGLYLAYLDVLVSMTAFIMLGIPIVAITALSRAIDQSPVLVYSIFVGAMLVVKFFVFGWFIGIQQGGAFLPIWNHRQATMGQAILIGALIAIEEFVLLGFLPASVAASLVVEPIICGVIVLYLERKDLRSHSPKLE